MRLTLIVCGLAVLGIFAPGANADEFSLGVSSRLDFQYFTQAPPELLGVADGATNLDAWLDFQGAWKDFSASARIRGHHSSKINDDPNELDLNRRHIEFAKEDYEFLAGHYYQTVGNALILRTLEQRFVSLNRVDRAFNLDQNLDGGRVKVDLDWVRAVGLVGQPRRGFLSEQGGVTEEVTDDLLVGGEGVFAVLEDHVEGGVGVIRAELSSPDMLWEDRLPMMMRSYRGVVRAGDWSAEGEYGESDPGDELRKVFYPFGTARYAKVQGSLGAFALSLEGKNYFNFEQFPYNQPPTLVRTHSSVLLNRSTHVVNLTDERGIQLETVYSPELGTTVIFNTSTADNRDHDSRNRFREVYLSGRREFGDFGAARLDLDWQENAQKFVENQWSAVLELERFFTDVFSMILDLEWQTVDKPLRDPHQNYLVQLSGASAGRWTLSGIFEHTTDKTPPDKTWFYTSLDYRLNTQNDFTLGAGSRPAGLICSGGFCFEAPAFNGVEFRWLGRF